MSHIDHKQRGVAVLEYKQKRKKRMFGIFILSAVLVGLAFISVMIGVYDISFWDLMHLFSGDVGSGKDVVLWSVRIPRTLSAIATGAALSLSGLLVQILLRNPLASPSTLGISHGAAFGAAFAIVILGAGFGVVPGFFGVTICALAGSALVSAVIMALSRLRMISSQAIVLAGVAISSLFMSGTILIQYFATEVELASVVFWGFGDVSRASLSETFFLIIILFPALIYCMLGRWKLKALGIGDEGASMLGVSPRKVRRTGVMIAALLAAVATAFCGVIAFMGLIAPHIARRLLNNDHRFVAPYSCLIGAILLLASDIAGRLLFSTTALPVGIITSFMGAPLFLYLLIMEKDIYDKC